jgi:N-acetylglucosamine kinase-like BadF-type ATPase
MEYLIGIDAGGTKSELTAYDLNDSPVLSLIGGAGNPSVNLEKTVNNLISLIYDCVTQLGRENCRLIAIGMAGVETGNYADLIKKYVEGAFENKAIVLNDGEMACKAYFGDSDGILVISVTAAKKARVSRECWQQQVNVFSRGKIYLRQHLQTQASTKSL